MTIQKTSGELLCEFLRESACEQGTGHVTIE